MSVFVHVCMGIYMYAYMYVKGHVGTNRCNVCAYKYMYTYLGLYVCVYVCTSIHICTKRHCVCMQSVCIQMQAYMSVFVSCLQVFFVVYINIHVRQIHMCVCIYLHICTRACKCIHTCLFLYMCVWVYICMLICM